MEVQSYPQRKLKLWAIQLFLVVFFLASLRLGHLVCLQSLAYRKVTMDYSYYQSSKAQKLNQFDQPKLVRFNLSKLVKVH